MSMMWPSYGRGTPHFIVLAYTNLFPHPFTTKGRTQAMAAGVTAEQQAVVDAVSACARDVAVSAFAGCGKTTTILECCAAAIGERKRCLVVTYNSELKDDNRRKLCERGWGQRDCVVHSFHSLALHFYGKAVISARGDKASMPGHHASRGIRASRVDDSFITEALLDDSTYQPFAGPYPNPKFDTASLLDGGGMFDLICVDEMQDMTPQLAALLRDFVLSMVSAVQYDGGEGQRRSAPPSSCFPRFLIVGDPFQMLYGYRGASLEYFLAPEDHFGPISRYREESGREGGRSPNAPWQHLRLTTSFRITHEMADWVNRNLSPRSLEVANPDWFHSAATQRIVSQWGDGIRANPMRGRCPSSVEYVTMSRPDMPRVAERFQRLCAEHGVENTILLASSLKATSGGNGRQRPLFSWFEHVRDRPWIHSSHSLGGEGSPDTRGQDGQMFHKDKYSASTIHAFKGMECDAVCVFGLDDFQEGYEATRADPLALFNAFYVACTRARNKLLVVQVGPSPYVTMRRTKGVAAPVSFGNLSVTDLFNHVGWSGGMDGVALDLAGAPGSIDSILLQQRIPTVHVHPSLREEPMVSSPTVLSMLNAGGRGSGMQMQTWSLIGCAVEMVLAYHLDLEGGFEGYISPQSLLSMARHQQKSKDSHLGRRRSVGNVGDVGVPAEEASFFAYCTRIASGDDACKESIYDSWANVIRFLIALRCVQDGSFMLWQMYSEVAGEETVGCTTMYPRCDWVVPAVMDALLASAVEGLYGVAKDLKASTDPFRSDAPPNGYAESEPMCSQVSGFCPNVRTLSEVVDVDEDDNSNPFIRTSQGQLQQRSSTAVSPVKKSIVGAAIKTRPTTMLSRRAAAVSTTPPAAPPLSQSTATSAAHRVDRFMCGRPLRLSRISREQLEFVLGAFFVASQVAVTHPSITSLDFDVVSWLPCVRGIVDFTLTPKSGAESASSAIVELKVTRSAEHAHAMQVGTYAAMKLVAASENSQIRAYVVNAYMGSCELVVPVPESLCSVAAEASTTPRRPTSWSSRLECRRFILRLIARKKSSAKIIDDAEVRRVAAQLEDPKVVINGLDRGGNPFPVLSDEQRSVVNTVCNVGLNCRVNAVAGSGKTTTILAVMKQFVERGERCLLLTYNSGLKTEIRQKVESRGWQHLCTVHNYHALVRSEYIGCVQKHNGTNFGAWVKEAKRFGIKQPLSPYALVAIDEVQDMNDDYAELVQDYISKCNGSRDRPPLVLLVGDPFQQIYKYSGAKMCYLQDPEKHFPFARPCGWELDIKLSISFRITHEMAAFINENMNPTAIRNVYPDWYEAHGGWIEGAWRDGIRAAPSRPLSPGSVVCHPGWASPDQKAASESVFRSHPASSMLISFSTRGSDKTPFQKLLVDSALWHVKTASIADEDSSDVAVGKRLATTIHSVKGLERDGVVVCGWDEYQELFDLKTKTIAHFDPLVVYNIFYVALTRARKQLAVLSFKGSFMTTRSSPHPVSDLPDVNRTPVNDTISGATLAAQVPSHAIYSLSGGEPGNFTSSEVYRCGKVEIPHSLRRSRGLTDHNTVENTSPVLMNLILLRVFQVLGVDRLSVIPLGCSSLKWVNGLRTDHPELHKLLASPSSLQTMTVASLSKLALAQVCLASQHTFLWAQVDPRFIEGGEPFIELAVKNTLKCLIAVAERICPIETGQPTTRELAERHAPSDTPARDPECEALAATLHSLVDVSQQSFMLPSPPMLLDPDEWRSSTSSLKRNQPVQDYAPASVSRLFPNATPQDGQDWKTIFPTVCVQPSFLLTPRTDTSSGRAGRISACVDLSMSPEISRDEVLTTAATGCVATCRLGGAVACFNIMILEGHCHQVIMHRDETVTPDVRADVPVTEIPPTLLDTWSAFEMPLAHLSVLRMLLRKRTATIPNRLTDSDLRSLVVLVQARHKDEDTGTSAPNSNPQPDGEVKGVRTRGGKWQRSADDNEMSVRYLNLDQLGMHNHGLPGAYIRQMHSQYEHRAQLVPHHREAVIDVDEDCDEEEDDDDFDEEDDDWSSDDYLALCRMYEEDSEEFEEEEEEFEEY